MHSELFLKSALLTCVLFVGTSTATASVTIPTVLVGNAGNAADPFTGGLYGSVGYDYFIGATEVTNAQYAAFLNAKAQSDPTGLYNESMAGSFGGITRTGSAGSYVYETVVGREKNPVNFVSFWDAVRFANWLHNGQGNGDTENGAYTITAAGVSSNTITRNSNWQWAVSSENEWYKAAYFQPASLGGDVDNYWLYPTSSNTKPTGAQANYGNSVGNTTPVGTYAPNFYGTFDMGGNVWEWNDTIIGERRGLRGGTYDSNSNGFNLRSENRSNGTPSNEVATRGFRVTQAVPEPTTMTVLALGAAAAMRRRRKS